jgi:hypothetical protein
MTYQAPGWLSDTFGWLVGWLALAETTSRSAASDEAAMAAEIDAAKVRCKGLDWCAPMAELMC